MNPLKLALTSLCTLFLLSAGFAPQPTPLADLIKDPAHWRGETVSFTLQFDSEMGTWNPWMTRFSPTKYLGFSAWSDQQQLWKEADFKAPQRRLFAVKNSAVAKALGGAPTYRRFEVTAVVRSIFNDQIWIEILAAKPLDHAIGAGTLVHAGRAMVLANEGHSASAIEQYNRALAAPMPKHMQAALIAERDRLAQAH